MTTTEKPNGNGSKLWQTWLPLGASAVLLIGAISSYFGQQGSASTTVANLQATVQAQNERINRLSDTVRILQLSAAEDCRQLATVEVQMATVETILNKTQVANQRDISLLWNKIYGQTYPDVFYAVSIPHEAMPCMH